MNIFVLSESPFESAQYLCDVHLRKMYVETAQMLANCFSLDALKAAPLTQEGNTRKYSHFNHPCSKWVRASLKNFTWTCSLAVGIKRERIYRGFGDHFTDGFISWVLRTRPDNLDGILYEMTPFALAMDDQYKVEGDAVQSYRNYYSGAKRFDKRGKFMLNYTGREQPSWLKEMLEATV